MDSFLVMRENLPEHIKDVNEMNNDNNFLENALKSEIVTTEEETEAIITDTNLLLNENLAITPSIKDDVETTEYRLLYALENGYTLFITEDDTTERINWKWDINPKELAKKQDSDKEAIKNRISLLDNAIKNSISKGTYVTTITEEVKSIRNKLLHSLAELVEEDNKQQRAKIIDKIVDDTILNYLKEVSDKLDIILTGELGYKIIESLEKHKEPTAKLLADYINNTGDFYLDYETRKRYLKTETGFKEVKIDDLTNYFNIKFGHNEISTKKATAVLDFITRSIKTDYDLITFTNGTLNTDTEVFKPNKFYDDRLTKLNLPFKYIEEAKTEYFKTPLASEIHNILKPVRNGWDWNENLYYKGIGSCATAYNETDKLFVIVGKPKARKSTLLTIIKRIFNSSFSEVKLQTIAKNERFKLIPTLRKSVNIDDDLQSFRINNLGFLNTFVSGGGGTVEIKGENVPAKLTAETTPRLWGASNKLPAVIGDGFERRLALILAENNFTKAEDDKRYMKRILQGKRDNEISLLFSYSIQLYFKTCRNQPITTEEQDEKMLDEWNWKSYPAKKGCEFMFIDTDTFLERLKDDPKVFNINTSNRWIITYEVFNEKEESEAKVVNTFVTVNEANKHFKRFHKWGLKSGRIFKEQARPSVSVIKQAMQNAGFNQTTKRETDTYTSTTVRVYEDCVLNRAWTNILSEEKRRRKI